MADLLEEFHWFFSLCLHFREWLVVLALMNLACLPFVRQYSVPVAALSFLVSCFHITQIAPFRTLPWQEKALASSKEKSVFYANVNGDNKDKKTLSKYLQTKSPNLVLLVEFNSLWANELKKVEELYPYHELIPQENNFGLAVFSQLPILSQKVFSDKRHQIPALFLKIKSKDSLNLLNVVLLHAHPPIGEYGTLIRNQYLENAALRIKKLEGPTLVCGDFNTTPWTSVFKNFLKETGLNFYKTPFLTNTWPANPIVPSLPIDFCLQKGVTFAKYSTGPNRGSDHQSLLRGISESWGFEKRSIEA